MSSLKFSSRFSHILFHALLTVVMLSIGGIHNAKAFALDSLRPSTWFLQAGVAEHNTQTIAAGATWDWNWQRQYSFGKVYGYSEASVGRWMTEMGGGSSAWETQIGITPVIRIQPDPWFVEIGIGANLILPIYRSDEKRFSTTFNFGDHLAIGRQFGTKHRHELALRVQHFSNGGIDHPNPGENFLQLRYSQRY